MKIAFIGMTGIAQRDTEMAFCIRNPEYVLNGAATVHEGDLWIPLANIMEDSHDVIEEAVQGDEVEIFVAKWFMEEL